MATSLAIRIWRFVFSVSGVSELANAVFDAGDTSEGGEEGPAAKAEGAKEESVGAKDAVHEL